MKKKMIALATVIVLTFSLVASPFPTGLSDFTDSQVITAKAATAGDFEYTENTTGVSITKYSGSASSLTIPSSINGKPVVSIDGFRNCVSLTSVVIPATVKRINSYTFDGCSNLQSISLTEGLSTIKDCAFIGCIGLTNLTIPATVTELDEDAFINCTSLSNVTVQKNNSNYASVDGILYNKSITRLILYPNAKSGDSYTMPNTVTSYSNYAFNGNTKLSTLTLSNGITVVGDSDFAETSLTTLNFPASVSSIGAYIFDAPSSCVNINVNVNNKYYRSVDGVLFNKNMTTLICYPSSKSGTDYIVPKTVKNFIYSVFEECRYLKEVYLPSGLTYLENATFNNCKNLTTIHFPSKLTSIGSYVFNGCTSLTNITIPSSVTSIKDNAFLDCTNLLNITLSNYDLAIANSAFDNTAWFNAQPDGLIYIGKLAFTYKGSMPVNGKIVFNNQTKKINDYLFYNNYRISDIVIPNGVTNIGEAAFYGCTSLKTVTIPSSVTKIGDFALGFCDSETDYDFGSFIPFYRIICTPKSAAEKYAKVNTITYSYTNAKSITTLSNIKVSSKVVYSTNKNNIIPSITIKMVLRH